MKENLYNACTLCPRNCKVNRLEGKKGVCGVDADLYVARAALHMWEEPCISGKEGSGAVFFSGCSLGCCFCQNIEISRGQIGKKISTERLSEIFLELQEKKANNINLVTATQFVPGVVIALEKAKEHGLQIPVVYNSSGYEKIDTLKMLEGLVDIYLPDYKYASSGTAKEYSKANDYPKIAKEALAEMHRQCPQGIFDDKGLMKRGMIVRHLLLPGHRKESEKIIQYLYETYGNDIYISIMSQYTPMAAVKEHPLLGRRVTKREYDKLLDFVVNLGVENGFFQEGDPVGESFIPKFDQEGV